MNSEFSYMIRKEGNFLSLSPLINYAHRTKDRSTNWPTACTKLQTKLIRYGEYFSCLFSYGWH
jgi:hypothetical protein